MKHPWDAIKMQTPNSFLPRSWRISTAIKTTSIPARQLQRTGQIRAIGSITSSTRFAPSFRPSSVVRPSCHLQRGRSNQWIARTAFSSSTRLRSEEGEKEQAEATSPAGGKPAYPERLIVYHAGTGKVTFLACLKLTTLFVFGFFDMIMTPAYLAAGEPLLKTAGVALCGLIPPLYVAFTTTPFVAAIHLHLPPYARHSRAILERFARTAPPNTRLDVTTMSVIGKPRVSSMALGDLRAVSPAVAAAAAGAPPEEAESPGSGRPSALCRLRRRLGLVNYVRDTAAADRGRKWYHFRAVGSFHVQDQGMGPQGDRRLKSGWVWPLLRAGIEKRSGAGGAGGRGQGQGQGQGQGKW
ncbi:hypothetical protein VTK26DRAFT_6283 [Humicola hyalothermophila]